MPPIINDKKCTFCKLCAQICPLNVLKADEDSKKIIVRYPDECWHCRACVIDCPCSAIKLRYPLSSFMLHKELDKNEEKGD